MSLLGLVRHMSEVERTGSAGRWPRRTHRRCTARTRTPTATGNGALPDAKIADEAWHSWRAEVAFAEQFVAGATDLGAADATGAPLRDVLAHMIEEYARHCGHADLLRERIDGRVGQ